MISVCMATFNGEQFIKIQVDSILKQLGNDDELVIVDDCSMDSTIQNLQRINDKRLRIHINDKNLGHVASFSKGISFCKGDYIFLADQDDVWVEGRVDLMIKSLVDSNCLLTSSNFVWIDDDERIIHIPYDGVSADSSGSFRTNIIDIFLGKTNYFGCAMAFRKELVQIILPIPEYVESHDLWIAKAANLLKSNKHLHYATLFKRKHLNNATSTKSSRSLYRKFYSRYIFVKSIFALKKKIKN